MRQFLTATKAFAEPTRLRVILALQAGELCVCELCDALGVVQSTLSTHLQYLRLAGLADTRNDGKWILLPAYQTDWHAWRRRCCGCIARKLEADPTLRTDRARLRRRLASGTRGRVVWVFLPNHRPKYE